jgi:hypothetical protein
MKIEFNLTKKIVSVCDTESVGMFSSLILPIVIAILSFPFVGPWAIAIGILSWIFEIIVTAGFLHETLDVDENYAFFFIWFPVVILAPITIPVDICSSVVKGIWKWFKKGRADKKTKSAYQSLLKSGLNEREIEIDLVEIPDEMTETSLKKIGKRLFQELITDQLDRSILKKSESGTSEKVDLIRVEKDGDKICIIGSFAVSETEKREDSSENKKIKGRVFGVTFSVSKQTGVCKVIHHTSRDLLLAHEEDQLEDLWFDITTASGFSSIKTSDPFERRMSKFRGPASGVVYEEKPLEDVPIQSQELE